MRNRFATLRKHIFLTIASVFEGGLPGLAIRGCLCGLDTVTGAGKTGQVLLRIVERDQWKITGEKRERSR